MSADHEPRCFRCGQPAAQTRRFHFLPNGAPCPVCRERLLESLPPALPGSPGVSAPPQSGPAGARSSAGDEART